jgi:hypothetical protein
LWRPNLPCTLLTSRFTLYIVKLITSYTRHFIIYCLAKFLLDVKLISHSLYVVFFPLVQIKCTCFFYELSP